MSKTKEIWKTVKTIYSVIGRSDLAKDIGKKITKVDAKYYISKIKNHFIGKNFAIIGPTGAGKTTFLNVLKNPNIVIDTGKYHGTEIEEFKSFKAIYKLYLEDLEEEVKLSFKVTGRYDVGGDFVEQHWPKVLNNADFVVYIASIEQLLADDGENYLEGIVKDFEFIFENYQLLTPNARIAIGFNKVDLLCTTKDLNKKIEELKPQIEKIQYSIHEIWGKKSRSISNPIILSLSDKSLRQRTLDNLFLNFVDELIKNEKGRNKYQRKAS